MKFFYLVWSNLKRKKLRTALTLLSIVVAFLLFGILCTIKETFTAGVTAAGADRLIVRHKVSLIMSLPVTFQQKIEQIPGVGETIRVIGRASISTDPALKQSFIVNDKTPRTVIVVAVERVFYQCTKAIVRSKLWDPAGHVDRKSLPSAGTILATISGGEIGGPEHDRAQPQRIKETLY